MTILFLSVKQAACVLSDEERKNKYSTLTAKLAFKVMMTGKWNRSLHLVGDSPRTRQKEMSNLFCA